MIIRIVIAAHAGIQKNLIEEAKLSAPTYAYWIPAFAGKTSGTLGMHARFVPLLVPARPV